MRTITSKIVNSLNEAMNNDAVEAERVVGITNPVQVHQCEDCASFYVVPAKSDESICPHCNGTGTPYGDIKKVDEDDDEFSDDPTLTEEDEEELKSEAELIVSETLRVLDRNDFKKFNECYRSRVRMTNKGELEAIVESVTAKRKMTSRQKSAYKLAEKYSPRCSTSSSNKKFESIRVRRQELMIKNESRAIKVAAAHILERQGAKYDYHKFNESMNKFIESRNIRRVLESIADEDKIGSSEFDKMTPDEIGDQVNTVIQDTGLEVIANDVDIDGDTATVNVRVQDSDDVEVVTDEVEEVLSDVFDAPVEITGPLSSEGDKSVAELSVVINPDEDLDEDDELDVPSENDLEEDDEFDVSSEKDLEEDDEEFKYSSEKNESLRRRRSRRSRRVNEKFVKGVGETPLFALLANESANNDPAFLANDDSLVSGNEDKAEELARVFVSEEAARKYLQDADLEDQYTPVSITVVTNESCESDDLLKEDDEFSTDDGTFFKKEGYCYHKDQDGKVREIDESEYDAAKADSEFDEDRIKESYRNKRRNTRSRRRR